MFTSFKCELPSFSVPFSTSYFNAYWVAILKVPSSTALEALWEIRHTIIYQWTLQHDSSHGYGTQDSSLLQTLQSLSENLQGRFQHNQASLCKSDIVVEISYMLFSFSHKGAPCEEDTRLFTIRINDVETTGLERTGHLTQALQSGITTKQAF